MRIVGSADFLRSGFIHEVVIQRPHGTLLATDAELVILSA